MSSKPAQVWRRRLIVVAAVAVLGVLVPQGDNLLCLVFALPGEAILNLFSMSAWHRVPGCGMAGVNLDMRLLVPANLVAYGLLGLAIALLIPFRPRRPPHSCQACGYDLTGNTSGVCPECGKSLATDGPARAVPATEKTEEGE